MATDIRRALFGAEETDRPQLAIEVIWTSGRLNKLEVYQKLGVKEVWYWRKASFNRTCCAATTTQAIERSVEPTPASRTRITPTS